MSSARRRIRVRLTPAAGSSRRIIFGDAHQGAGQLQQLLLAAGKVRGVLVAQVDQVDELEHLVAFQVRLFLPGHASRGSSQVHQSFSPSWSGGTSIRFSSTVMLFSSARDLEGADEPFLEDGVRRQPADALAAGRRCGRSLA